MIYGYVRVSTHAQEDGSSLDAQRDIISRWCEKELGGVPDRVFVDGGVSAWKYCLPERPGGLELYRHLKKGDVVVVTAIDRAFRNARDALNCAHDWDKLGVDYQFTQLGKAEGFVKELMITMLAIVAKMESNRKSERQKESIRYLHSVGRYHTGNPPKGTKIVKRNIKGGKKGSYLVICKKSLTKAAKIKFLNRVRGWTQEQIAMTITRWIDPSWTPTKLRMTRGWPFNQSQVSYWMTVPENLKEKHPSHYEEASQFMEAKLAELARDNYMIDHKPPKLINLKSFDYEPVKL